MEENIAINAELASFLSLVNTAITVITIVAMWFVFSKAGEKGWKIFIPIYGTYVKFKIAGCKKWFWFNFFLTMISVVLFIVGISQVMELKDIAMTYFLIASVFLFAASIISITAEFKMAKAFGLPVIFGLGLWLVPYVFYPIIAFNKNIQYADEFRLG